MAYDSKFGRFYGHRGATPGHEALMGFNQESGLHLSITQNLGPNDAISVASDIIEKLFNGNKKGKKVLTFLP